MTSTHDTSASPVIRFGPHRGAVIADAPLDVLRDHACYLTALARETRRTRPANRETLAAIEREIARRTTTTQRHDGAPHDVPR
jgi:hypothetical protein